MIVGLIEISYIFASSSYKILVIAVNVVNVEKGEREVREKIYN